MEAVLLMGIPGSGKSTFCKERFFETHIRINLDMLRTREREKLLFDACLNAKQPLVVDNTNPSAKDRSRYIIPAKIQHFRIIVFYLSVGIDEALERNAQRPKSTRVPAVGVRSIRNRIERPLLNEGIDERYYVRMGGGGTFVVEEFSDEI